MTPKHLYKYRCWSNAYHKRWLTDNEIFFASPGSLNDPHDSTIPLRFDKGTDDQAFKMALEIVEKDFPRYSAKAQQELAKDIVNLENWKKPGELSKFREFRQQYINDNFGICSFAGNKEIDLAWSHYAEGHKGICVGFDSQKLLDYLKYTIGKTGITINLHPVDYVVDFPYLDGFDTIKSLIRNLTTKSSKWEYEEEYRFILFTGTNKAIRLEDDIIVEVNLGCRMSQADKDEIADILRKRSRRIVLYETLPSSDRFGLEFKETSY